MSDTRKYLERNSDGDNKPIGITGLIFGAIVMLAFFYEAVNLLWQSIGA